jgi:hypothetical protein
MSRYHDFRVEQKHVVALVLSVVPDGIRRFAIFDLRYFLTHIQNVSNFDLALWASELMFLNDRVSDSCPRDDSRSTRDASKPLSVDHVSEFSLLMCIWVVCCQSDKKVDVVASPAGTRFASFPTNDRLVVRTHMEDL